tara:strand:+ start:1968 stop:2519 length:552 start_codon:yes stop_codon:yes gene_type:complete
MALYKLSDEEKRIRKNEKSRVYREKNYERIKAKRNTPEAKLKQRLNYIKTMTPEKRKLKNAYNRVHYHNSLEYQHKRQRIYSNSKVGMKKRRITKWKASGLILKETQTYDEIYGIYSNTHKCDICRKPFKKRNHRYMDHDHKTGFFRHVLCPSCNNQDFWIKKQRKDAQTIIYRNIIDFYSKL